MHLFGERVAVFATIGSRRKCARETGEKQGLRKGIKETIPPSSLSIALLQTISRRNIKDRIFVCAPAHYGSGEILV